MTYTREHLEFMVIAGRRIGMAEAMDTLRPQGRLTIVEADLRDMAATGALTEDMVSLIEEHIAAARKRVAL